MKLYKQENKEKSDENGEEKKNETISFPCNLKRENY